MFPDYSDFTLVRICFDCYERRTEKGSMNAFITSIMKQEEAHFLAGVISEQLFEIIATRLNNLRMTCFFCERERSIYNLIHNRMVIEGGQNIKAGDKLVNK